MQNKSLKFEKGFHQSKSIFNNNNDNTFLFIGAFENTQGHLSRQRLKMNNIEI